MEGEMKAGENRIPLPLDMEAALQLRDMFERHAQLLSRIEWEFSWAVGELTASDAEAEEWRQKAREAWEANHETYHCGDEAKPAV